MYEKRTAPNYDLAAIEPLNISPWLAMSLLHKSIRRKRPEWALKAAATLYKSSPQRLTRRLCIIGFEDVGLADAKLVKASAFAINCSDTSTLAQLTVSMASTNSCRAADDLFVICEHWPPLEPLRNELSNLGLPQLLSRAEGFKDIVQKALCLCIALRSKRILARPQVFAWLKSQGLSPEFTDLCERGYKATREPLCALFGLLWLYAKDVKHLEISLQEKVKRLAGAEHMYRLPEELIFAVAFFSG